MSMASAWVDAMVEGYREHERGVNGSEGLYDRDQAEVN